MLIIARFLLSGLLSLTSLAAFSADIWYEDGNLGRPGGIPSDFYEKFSRPNTFKKASQYIDVYMVRARTLSESDDKFLTEHFHPYLKKNKIKLAINAGGATWAQRPNRKNVIHQELALLKRLKTLGLTVDYISLQSVLSKEPKKREGEKEEYELSKRVEDIVMYAKEARAIFPLTQIGIIDALPSHGKDYRHAYRLVADAMSREGMALAFIHLDMPFDIPKSQHRGISWQSIRDVEQYVEQDLGIRFGLFATTRKGGEKSSKEFHEGVMAALNCYAGADGTPGDFIIASWFPYPQYSIPDDASGSDYPSMRTVLEFGRQLDQVEKEGKLLSMRGKGAAEWNALCTLN